MTKRVTDLTLPDMALREAALAGLDRGDSYATWVSQFQCLNELEITAAAAAHPPPPALRIGAWNLERGSRWTAAQAVIMEQNLDLVLLTEMDHGMSRSRQEHTTRALCHALGWHGIFAVEFVELGLGNPWELNQPVDPFNQAGLHGNAIISRYPLRNPKLLRFSDSDGSWWHRRFSEARLGGRIALVAEIATTTGVISCVVTHLENNTSPTVRSMAIDELLNWHGNHDLACVVGGDFNTSTIDPTETSDPFQLRQILVESDPERFRNPEVHEPLFEVFSKANFHWNTANTRDVSQRTRERGYPKPPLGRIDWLFTRHLSATEARTTAAVDSAGHTIADHELIQATVTAS